MGMNRSQASVQLPLASNTKGAKGFSISIGPECLAAKLGSLRYLQKKTLVFVPRSFFCRRWLLVWLRCLAGIRKLACGWNRQLYVVDLCNTHGHIVGFGKCFVGYCFDSSLCDDRAVAHQDEPVAEP